MSNDDYSVEVGGQRFTKAQWRAVQEYVQERASTYPAGAATVEIVENRPLGKEHLGVMKPNVIRINGIEILCPREDPIEIEDFDRPGDMTDGLIVRVRMFARRVIIGEPL